MGMPSAQVQPGTQPPAGQFFQAGQFTTGMGSGTPGQPVPLNAMNLPVVGPSQEVRDAAFARQDAELQARIARRAAGAARGGDPKFYVTGWDAPGDAAVTQPQGQTISQPTTNFTAGQIENTTQTQAPVQQPVTQTPAQNTANSQGKGFSQPGSSSAQGGGKGGSPIYSRTSGQPSFGQPNRYPNTVGQWDNASIQRTNQSPMAGGKGKG